MEIYCIFDNRINHFTIVVVQIILSFNCHDKEVYSKNKLVKKFLEEDTKILVAHSPTLPNLSELKRSKNGRYYYNHPSNEY